MSLADKLKAMSTEHKKADKKALKTGVADPEWSSKEKLRNDIPVLVNQTQDLKVLHVGILEEKDGMGECISFLLESQVNHATFNVRWYWETKERDGSPARENQVTKNLLLQVKEKFGLYEDEVEQLKGMVIHAKVEQIVGFGKDHYAISNLDVPRGKVTARVIEA